jgi:hypothetical protein
VAEGRRNVCAVGYCLVDCVCASVTRCLVCVCVLGRRGGRVDWIFVDWVYGCTCGFAFICYDGLHTNTHTHTHTHRYVPTSSSASSMNEDEALPLVCQCPLAVASTSNPAPLSPPFPLVFCFCRVRRQCQAAVVQVVEKAGGMVRGWREILRGRGEE